MNPFKLNRKRLVKSLLIRALRKNIKKQRRGPIRPLFLNRLEYGESIIIKELRSDPLYHHRYFRMSKESFDEILDPIKAKITGQRTHSRPISAEEKLAVTLRFLASGNSQISLAFSARISPASISRILRETMKEICASFTSIYLPDPKTENWKESEEGFAKIWNFPNCCGALDGKHIRTIQPARTGSQNFNYKGYFSQVLLAIVGPDYKFLSVDIGASGSQSDGGIFVRSPMGQRLTNGRPYLPEGKKVGAVQLPYVIVADDAFPLKQTIMKPYPGKFLVPEKRIFNYRLSRARMVSECAFGIFAARWRIFQGSINADSEFVKLIIQTCVILHNFLMSKKDMSALPKDIIHDTETGKNKDTLESCSHQGSNNFTANAFKIREEFCKYFNGDGAVYWQNNIFNQ